MTFFRQLADRFRVSESTVLFVVTRICRGITVYLRQIATTWPTVAQVDETIRGFGALKGFPNVLCAIDGSHIPIKPAAEDRLLH